MKKTLGIILSSLALLTFADPSVEGAPAEKTNTNQQPKLIMVKPSSNTSNGNHNAATHNSSHKNKKKTKHSKQKKNSKSNQKTKKANTSSKQSK